MPFRPGSTGPLWRADQHKDTPGAPPQTGKGNGPALNRPSLPKGEADTAAPAADQSFVSLASLAEKEQNKTMATDAGRRAAQRGAPGGRSVFQGQDISGGAGNGRPGQLSPGAVAGPGPNGAPRSASPQNASPMPKAGVGGSTGSIYADAVRKGLQQAEDPKTASRPTGSIYADAVRRGVLEAAGLVPPAAGKSAPPPKGGVQQGASAGNYVAGGPDKIGTAAPPMGDFAPQGPGGAGVAQPYPANGRDADASKDGLSGDAAGLAAPAGPKTLYVAPEETTHYNHHPSGIDVIDARNTNASAEEQDSDDEGPGPPAQSAGNVRDAILQATARAREASRHRQPAPANEPDKKKKKTKPAKPGKDTELRATKQRPAYAAPADPNPVLRTAGNFFYTLGFYAECKAIVLWRYIRDVGILIGQMLVWLFGGLFSSIRTLITGLVQDVKAPVVRMRLRRENRSRQQGTDSAISPRDRARQVVAAFGGLAGLLLPVGALAIFIFTVYSVMSMEYALAVEVNGQVIGHISSESVLEDAKNIIRDRIHLSDDQNLEDWQFSPELHISNTNHYTSKQQLANEILRNSSVDIIEATGLTVDGELIAVTTEGEKLREYLDGVLAEHERTAQSDARVSFVRSIECDPESDDVFLTSTVEDYDTLIEKLSRVVSEEKKYTATGEESLADIAHNNNILFETLIARNPDYAELEGDFVPEAGSEFLIQRAEPYLQVQTSVQRQETEVIPFAVVENETDQKAKGVVREVQSGIDGLREVWVDYIYVENELADRVIVEEKTRILQQPQEQIIEVGTYDFADAIVGGYNPAYMFPVPDSTFSSRGMGGGHRGRDINAPDGTPIFACNAGVVRYAGWHYSYGYYIEIDHPDGLMTLYAHCSYLNVSEGDVVQQGQYIAAVGSTGMSTGPHCHLEFQQGGQLLNPDDYVRGPY